jgi:hypothetical protein
VGIDASFSALPCFFSVRILSERLGFHQNTSSERCPFLWCFRAVFVEYFDLDPAFKAKLGQVMT